MLYDMSISEARRHDLYNGLNDLLGAERADTLMAYLPTDTDLVTKGDLVDLESRQDIRFGEMEARLAGRFNGFNARIDGLETRIDGIETRIDGLDSRLDGFDSRMDRLEASMDGFNRRLDRFFLTMLIGVFSMVAALMGSVFIG